MSSNSVQAQERFADLSGEEELANVLPRIRENHGADLLD